MAGYNFSYPSGSGFAGYGDGSYDQPFQHQPQPQPQPQYFQPYYSNPYYYAPGPSMAPLPYYHQPYSSNYAANYPTPVAPEMVPPAPASSQTQSEEHSNSGAQAIDGKTVQSGTFKGHGVGARVLGRFTAISSIK